MKTKRNKKLDLHRLKHREAERKTIRFLETNWGSNREVEIITGNSGKMRRLVMDILDEYGLHYQVGRPYDLNNKGYIITWME